MKRLDRITRVFLVLAIVWVGTQLVLAFFVHVTERARLIGGRWVVPPTKTYMQAFGSSEVVLTIVSVGLVLAVGLALQHRRRNDRLGAGGLAWTLSAVTAILGLVGFAYLFGVAVCLLLACATMPRRSVAASTGGRAPADAVATT